MPCDFMRLVAHHVWRCPIAPCAPVQRPTTGTSTRSGARRITPTSNIGVLFCGRHLPTPPHRTRSAPAQPASSPSSTTSPGVVITSPRRQVVGPLVALISRQRERAASDGQRSPRSTASTSRLAWGIATTTPRHRDRRQCRGRVRDLRRHALQRRLLLRLRKTLETSNNDTGMRP